MDYQATYDRYWSEPSRVQREISSQDRQIADEIQRCVGLGSLLDVGCGDGRLVRQLGTLGFDARGVDVSGVVVDMANRACPDRFGRESVLQLSHEDAAFDFLACVYCLEHLEEQDVATAIDELFRVARSSVYLRIATTPDAGSTRRTVKSREWWESKCFAAGFRKHPRYFLASPFGSLDSVVDQCTILLEKLPTEAARKYSIADLQEERQLHMDMSREPGRRSDAHIVRYFEAARCIRPGDRVLDAACGLGYGSTVMTGNSRCASYSGIDFSAYAVDYARLNFPSEAMHLRFEEGSLPECLEKFDDGSFDFIASFETLEHLRDPHSYLKECHRLLTPGGRLIISVPNDWAEEDGIDPNPHHFHVYDWQRVLAELEAAGFLIERTIAETVSRRKEAGKWTGHGFEWTEYAIESVRGKPGEWCIVLAMKSPFATAEAKFDNSAFGETQDATPNNVMDFAEQYENPWLLPSLVTRGLRTERKQLRQEIADVVLGRHKADADEAAALCVKAYGLLGDGSDWSTVEALLRRFEPHIAPRDWLQASPIEVRWAVSLTYVAALLALECGQRERAKQLLAECIEIPFLRYAPLLATKTVSAALLRAKLALVDNDLEGAKDWLSCGAEASRLAVTEDWDTAFGDLAHQPLPAFRELAEVLELGSQCIAGLTLLSSSTPGPVFYELVGTNKTVEIDQLLKYQKVLLDAITWHQGKVRTLQSAVEHWKAEAHKGAPVKRWSKYVEKQYKKLRNSLRKRLKE